MVSSMGRILITGEVLHLGVRSTLKITVPDLWDNAKHPNIRIIGVPEEDKKGVPLLIVTGVTVVICVTRLPKPSRNVIQSRTGQWSMVGEPAESCELPRGQEQVSRAFTPP